VKVPSAWKGNDVGFTWQVTRVARQSAPRIRARKDLMGFFDTQKSLFGNKETGNQEREGRGEEEQRTEQKKQKHTIP